MKRRTPFFLSFANASNIILGESELDTFIVGFRLGAKFAYDTFVDDNAPYADFMLNFAGDEFDMMISVSPRTLIISSAITLGVSILVSFLFRRKINKLNMVEALKGVE